MIDTCQEVGFKGSSFRAGGNLDLIGKDTGHFLVQDVVCLDDRVVLGQLFQDEGFHAHPGAEDGRAGEEKDTQGDEGLGEPFVQASDLGQSPPEGTVADPLPRSSSGRGVEGQAGSGRGRSSPGRREGCRYRQRTRNS